MHNTDLATSYLELFDITDEDAKLLASSLACNKTLQTLGLNCNISDDGLKTLTNVVS